MKDILVTLIPIICTSMCTYLIARLEKRDKKKSNSEKAMMVLMRRELRELHDQHMEAGKISPEALGDFNEIYEIYHELGGNGIGTVWKNDVEKLERR